MASVKARTFYFSSDFSQPQKMDVQLVQLMGDVVDKPERFFLPETAMACELLELTRSLFSIGKPMIFQFLISY
jgi:hypothetical protein